MRFACALTIFLLGSSLLAVQARGMDKDAVEELPQFKSLSGMESTASASSSIPIITTSSTTGMARITDDTDLALPANPVTAFNNMQSIMKQVENAFMVVVNEYQKLKSLGDARQQAVEAKAKDLEYRRRIMERLQIDYETLRKNLKEKEETLEKVDTEVATETANNERLTSDDEKQRAREQSAQEQVKALLDKEKKEKEDWEIRNRDLKTRFNLQTEELQKAQKELTQVTQELEYARRLLEKEEVDYQTEKQKIAQQEQEIQSKQAKDKELQQKIEELQKAIKAAEDAEATAKKNQDTESAQFNAEIDRQKAQLGEDAKKIADNELLMKSQADQLAENKRRLAELQGQISSGTQKNSQQKSADEARINSVQQRFDLELKRKELNYEYQVNQKQHEIDAIRIQVTHQAQEITNLQSQIDNWKSLHTTATKVGTASCAPKPCPCNCIN